MNSTTRAKPETETSASFDAIVSDLAALRQDFADLMSQMKSGALKGANGAAENILNQLGDRAGRLYDSVAAQGGRLRQSGQPSGRGATRGEPPRCVWRWLHCQPAAEPLSAVNRHG